MQHTRIIFYGPQKASRSVSACDDSRTAIATQRNHVPTAAVALVTTACSTVLWGTAGAASAESEAAQEPAMPPPPSFPEAVSKFAQQLTNDFPSETAPSLTDSTAEDSPSKEEAASADDNDGSGKNSNDAQV